MTKKASSMAIVISSYDKGSDLWEPFFYLFDKFWPHCNYPVYLITNMKQGPQRSYLKTINTGPDQKWATNLKKAIEQIHTEYILYLQDDYFINRQVNPQLLHEGLKFLRQQAGAHLRLMPSPRPDKKISGETLFGRISTYEKFRVCLQAGIWKKNILQNLLVEGESAWDMESKGTLRSQQMKEQYYSFLGGDKNKSEGIPLSYFYCEPIENCFFTGVNQGYWLYEAIKFLQSEGYNPYPTKRLVCSVRELFQYPMRFYFKKRTLYSFFIYNYIVQELLMTISRITQIVHPY